MSQKPLALKVFEGFGLELEYMIVDESSLAVLPIADRVLKDLQGEITSEFERGDCAWSNELVLHVLELKNPLPTDNLYRLNSVFQFEVDEINRLLKNYGGKLLPTAMHPFMNPETDTKLWPHDFKSVYSAYNRIFNCKGHGWSNLQSTHLNLAFSNDEEFGRLHKILRVLMPLIPALSASSPLVESKRGAWLSTRLWYYLQNQRRLPSIIGHAVPEPVWTKSDYEQKILSPMYREIAPHDPDGELQFEWLNSRSVIPKFERNSFEIRILDIQECPRADFAITNLLLELIKKLYGDSDFLRRAEKFTSQHLKSLMSASAEHGTNWLVDDSDFIELWTEKPLGQIDFKSLLSHISSKLPLLPDSLRWLEIFQSQGCLAERILGRIGDDLTQSKMKEVYTSLAGCLESGTYFEN